MKVRPLFDARSQTDPPPVKLSVNVSTAVGHRLRRMAFDERLSESSIVEVALIEFFDRVADSDVGAHLRANGATLRRSRSSAK